MFSPLLLRILTFFKYLHLLWFKWPYFIFVLLNKQLFINILIKLLCHTLHFIISIFITLFPAHTQYYKKCVVRVKKKTWCAALNEIDIPIDYDIVIFRLSQCSTLIQVDESTIISYNGRGHLQSFCFFSFDWNSSEWTIAFSTITFKIRNANNRISHLGMCFCIW